MRVFFWKGEKGWEEAHSRLFEPINQPTTIDEKLHRRVERPGALAAALFLIEPLTLTRFSPFMASLPPSISWSGMVFGFWSRRVEGLCARSSRGKEFEGQSAELTLDSWRAGSRVRRVMNSRKLSSACSARDVCSGGGDING